MPLTACFGEVLWDCLPRGIFLGGAPMNVAYHLHQLGREALPVSAVGPDFLGEEVHRRLAGWGIDTAGIVTDDHPTGVVQVDLDDDGQPTYTIVEGVAWDHIAIDPACEPAIRGAEALVFGSLAQRHHGNREVLESLVADHPGLKVCDVNLRSPYDDLDLARHLARLADLVKLNDQEIGRLHPEAVDLESAARELQQTAACRWVCVTAGSRGAGLLADDDWSWADPEPITVRDAVGAGDAFCAALIDGLLRAADPTAVLTRASRLAEFVATSDGATPHHDHAPTKARRLDR